MLSVLIVNWNTKDLLLSCLDSLCSNPPQADFEVIVVDNASTDGSAAAVKERFPSVVLIEPGSNTGYARGNNLAFARARGDFLLTLNPDTELAAGQLDAAIRLLSGHQDAGALAPRLIGADGNVQRSVRGFPSLFGILGEITGLAKRFPLGRLGSYSLPAFDYSRPGTAPQPMGTFLLFKRSALERVGDPRRPFDEQFPIFFNEVDLLFRLQKVGFTCRFEPSIEVKHLGGASTRQVKKSMIWESHRSLLRYFAKHFRTPWNTVFFPLLALIVYLAAFVRARGFHAGFRP